ncbi:MAG: hypothetical protein AAFX99_20440, partial [Myxococcota bacterium]
ALATFLALIGSLMAMLGLSLWALPIVMGLMAILMISYNRLALLGNRTLERRLRQRLNNTDGVFVGLCKVENNRILALRVETDDNIGFLELHPDNLLIRTEEGVLSIAPANLQRITTELMRDLPYLSWIRLDYTRSDNGEEDSILLYSRQVVSLRQARRAAQPLHDRLVQWMVEGQQLTTSSPLDDEFAALEATYGDRLEAEALSILGSNKEDVPLADRLEEEFAALEAQLAHEPDALEPDEEEELARLQALVSQRS